MLKTIAKLLIATLLTLSLIASNVLAFHKVNSLPMTKSTEWNGDNETRKDYEFDNNKLQEWLDENIKSVGRIQTVEQFKGGQSNPTYKITTENKKLVNTNDK